MATIVWFRRDLRLADNPALAFAADRGPIVPVFILEDPQSGSSDRPLGAAAKWWLHHSLEELGNDIGDLILVAGDPVEILPRLAMEIGATGIVWNRRYDPDGVATDRNVKRELVKHGLEVETFNASLLHEPWELATGEGKPYKVYSAFWRMAKKRPVPQPVAIPEFRLARLPGETGLADLGLLPHKPNWAAGWEKIWTPGEKGARTRFADFLSKGLPDYPTGRDFPARNTVSRLSAHLRFGEISPRQIWTAVQFATARDASLSAHADRFLGEIGWREFAHHLLFHFPDMATENLKPQFDRYPWRDAPADLRRWQKGQTGYPLVDAGMRELWKTGYMHNRVRMVAASFLVKHLRIHWREGEAWFWDTLVDADLANNAAGWQWVAGSGADAAPYFRIFNPTTQAEKFDPDGSYIRRWCPELAKLGSRAIHAPFNASRQALRDAGVELGRTYPPPMVDHGEARAAALAGYERISK